MRETHLRSLPLLIAYWVINNYINIDQCMRREEACRLPGTTVPWANLYRCNTYAGNTAYTTPVACRARQHTGNVVDQTTSTVTVLS